MGDAGAEIEGCAEVAECLAEGVELEVVVVVIVGVVVVFVGFARYVGVGYVLGVELSKVPASDTGEGY